MNMTSKDNRTMNDRELLGPELMRLGIVFHWPSWEHVSDGFDPDRYIHTLRRTEAGSQ